MGPPLVTSNCALKNKLVNLEEKLVVFGCGVRRFGSVSARQNHIPNTDQLSGFDWI